MSSAQPPTLTFPLIVNGGGARVELALTNPGNGEDVGTVFFRGEDGQPLELNLDGIAVSSIPYRLAAGGALKVSTDGSGELQTGYVIVRSDTLSSSISGSIVYEINGAQVSVPASVLDELHHVFVERDQSANSGLALVNVLGEAIRLDLELLDHQGQPRGGQGIELASGAKQARFISEVFGDLPIEFRGTVQLSSSRPFALLGLRQRSDGRLSTLAGAQTAFRGGSSQILFLIDSGISLEGVGFGSEDLDARSVRQLTGFDSAARKQFVHIINTHPRRAVTVQIRVFNSSCQAILTFLAVVLCNETLVFDPFDFDVPFSSFNTSIRFFGEGDPGPAANQPLSGTAFGDGRFVVSTTAVGTSTDGDDRADLLFAREAADPVQGQCGIEPDNTGTEAGPQSQNLHSCNAVPMNFEHLKGYVSRDGLGECQGPVGQADEELRVATDFTRTMVETSRPPQSFFCLQPEVPPSCGLMAALESLSPVQCDDQADTGALLVRFPGVPQRLLPITR